MEQMIEADAALKQTNTEWLDMTKAQLAAPVRKRTLPLQGRHVARASDSLQELGERLKAVVRLRARRLKLRRLGSSIFGSR